MAPPHPYGIPSTTRTRTTRSAGCRPATPSRSARDPAQCSRPWARPQHVTARHGTLRTRCLRNRPDRLHHTADMARTSCPTTACTDPTMERASPTMDPTRARHSGAHTVRPTPTQWELDRATTDAVQAQMRRLRTVKSPGGAGLRNDPDTNAQPIAQICFRKQHGEHHHEPMHRAHRLPPRRMRFSARAASAGRLAGVRL
jgi:hypothetical protein